MPEILIRRQRSAAQGITLIETLIVVCATALLGRWSTAQLQPLLQARALQAIANELAADLRWARQAARGMNQGVRLQVQSEPNGACYILHTGGRGDCECSANGQAICKGESLALKSRRINTAGISLTASSSSMLWYPSYGTVSPTGTLRLQLPDGRAVHHVVNIMGRARSCTPAAQVAGYPSC